jgi:hypothetical protein
LESNIDLTPIFLLRSSSGVPGALIMVLKTIKTGIGIHAFTLLICINNYANMTSSHLHRHKQVTHPFL